MNISAPFIERPIATTLLTIAIALAGGVGYVLLPVSPLPQVEFPTIQVSAGLPGASPETMASSVATPLERQFGRIAGLTEMTSASQLGSTQVVLQFDLSRDIDGAARDVQAAINAARSQLPANLPGNPSYRKVNPADAPIMMLALTSDLVSRAQMYDLASSVLQQRIAQVDGVGQVFVGGGALPAVRVEVNPTALNARGLGLEDLRAFLRSANVNSPKGQLGSGARSWSLASTDQLYNASAYQPLVVSYNNGGAVRLQDVADVVDSVEDVRTGGYANGKPAVLIIVSREPGANIIAAVDGIRALLPTLQASVPPTTTLSVLSDRTTTIRASVHDVQITMLISIALVVLVVFGFLQNVRYTIIPAVVVPVSLIGTLAVMYLFGYSLDNLSLMALTIATGFVVDDAIVVIENISRHMEKGVPPLQASLLGAKEIGFTVISISLSLVAVFIPILLMSGIVGRLFREFAVTLSIAIIVSLAVSLTTTPMMCAYLLGPRRRADGSAASDRRDLFDWIRGWYGRSLTVVLRHQGTTLAVTLATMLATGYLYIRIPKGFFPQQDTGAITGSIQADQDTSFQAMQQRVARFGDIVLRDPGVATVLAYVGGGGIQNSARMFVNLKPRGERDADATAIINRLRRRLTDVPGAVLYLQAAQDLRIGGRSSSAQYQYTLQSDDVVALNDWAPRLYDRLRRLPGLTDVNSDLLTRGLQASLSIDRPTASRLGITPQAIDDTLYDAFGQRQVSTMYTALNQVPRRHGSRAVVLAEPARPWSHLPADEYWRPGAASRVCPVCTVDGPAGSQSPDSVSVGHHFLQPGARSCTRRCGDGDRGDGAGYGGASVHARQLPGHGTGLSTVAGQPALARRRGARGGLRRARSVVRKLHSPHHDSFDAAVGRRRCASGADAVPNGTDHHCARRHHPAHRYRQEERDPDDRLRARGRARGRQAGGRGALPSLCTSLPADSDDDDGGPVRRAAARSRLRDRRRAATPARHRHRGRLDRQPGAHALHDAGCVFVSGQAQS